MFGKNVKGTVKQLLQVPTATGPWEGPQLGPTSLWDSPKPRDESGDPRAKSRWGPEC